jgi:MFS family permease
MSPLDAEYSNMVEVEGNVHVINAFLDKVGMGRYQWHLWVLCGFGWIADQMLLQMLAVIQPRVQAEFNLDGFKVGGITTSFFAGLATGAAIWGIGADIWGRKLAFNCTLLTAGVFGMAMGGQMNYAGLCGIAAAIATGTGGNLPLDGAIYLEASPRVNQRCLMLMSIFWCIGQRKDLFF